MNADNILTLAEYIFLFFFLLLSFVLLFTLR